MQISILMRLDTFGDGAYVHCAYNSQEEAKEEMNRLNKIENEMSIAYEEWIEKWNNDEISDESSCPKEPSYYSYYVVNTELN